MRVLLTLAIIGGGVYAFARWKRDVEEGERDAEWRAEQKRLREQRDQELEGLYERL